MVFFFLFSFPSFLFSPPFFFLRPSRCISVARQMSLNARPGLPFQKLNVSSSVVSISTQADQLFSGLFNLSDRNMRLTLWHTPASGNPDQIDRYWGGEQIYPMIRWLITPCKIKGPDVNHCVFYVCLFWSPLGTLSQNDIQWQALRDLRRLLMLLTSTRLFITGMIHRKIKKKNMGDTHFLLQLQTVCHAGGPSVFPTFQIKLPDKAWQLKSSTGWWHPEGDERLLC